MELTAAEKAKKFDARQAKERRYWIKQQMILKKAEEKGIKVSEAEVDEEYKKRYPKG